MVENRRERERERERELREKQKKAFVNCKISIEKKEKGVLLGEHAGGGEQVMMEQTRPKW
jgi:hypothetical protein